ncbi:hypothetical protein CHGG_04942 [Chaetomium globosum CBS 148.51]|uniref:Uncharacterized protein n=1 Tax=Chaetomium globosum (strain ATCC 6205 / CBS 148.51 / DSM 1962 / NBRC 6347 / NRRL 1970) TaxID=306901 RepID=Q2GZV4_CHAGB|nr:uncharacterized protein CHGG_04942 [Chaetomium globosum CBS 148.51]EAQ88323.1 hypothetical protein CHGG_04942 [Chaetomium globosum CBS 148.51]
MPRQLPWKVGAGAAKQTPSRLKAAASPAPSASRSPAPHRPTPTRKTEPTPDSRRLMIEGIDHDDQYRMVEDEFRAVAGDFTRHLHAAEYQRLKGLAKSRNSETIETISRPVTGEMTDLVKRRHVALDAAPKQRQAVAKTLGKRASRDGSDEEASSRRPATSSLQGLMDSPRKPTALLTSLPGSRPSSSNRGAAAGSPSRRRPSGQEARMVVRNNSMDLSHRASVVPPTRPSTRVKQETTSGSDEDDDDLDGLPSWPRKHASSLPRVEKAERPPVQRAPASEPPAKTIAEADDVSNPFLKAGTARLQTPAQETFARQQVAELAALKDEDEDDDFFARLRARRAEQRRRRETKAQGSNNKNSEANAASINSIPFM